MFYISPRAFVVPLGIVRMTYITSRKCKSQEKSKFKTKTHTTVSQHHVVRLDNLIFTDLRISNKYRRWGLLFCYTLFNILGSCVHIFVSFCIFDGLFVKITFLLIYTFAITFLPFFQDRAKPFQ